MSASTDGEPLPRSPTTQASKGQQTSTATRAGFQQTQPTAGPDSPSTTPLHTQPHSTKQQQKTRKHTSKSPRTDHPHAPNTRSNTQVQTQQTNPEPDSLRTDTATSSVKTRQQHPQQDDPRKNAAACSVEKLNSNTSTEIITPKQHPQAKSYKGDRSSRFQELLGEFETETRIEPKRQILRQIRKELNLKDRGPLPRRIFRGDDGTIAKLCRDLGYKEKRHEATTIEPKHPSETRGSRSRDPQKKEDTKRKRKKKDQKSDPHIRAQPVKLSRHHSHTDAEPINPNHDSTADASTDEPAPAPPPNSPGPNTCT